MAGRNRYEDSFEDVSSFSSDSDYKKTRRAKKGRHKGLKIFISVFCVLLIIFGGGLLYVSNYLLGGLTTNEITKDRDELGILSGVITDPKITNIALFGVDSRGDDFSGRSDAIMVLSIDEIHKKVKITSLLRDIRVYMGDDYPYTDTGYDKLNHAYAWEGPESAIRVINQNFKLDITDYVTVNFNKLASIVDAFNGIDIEITEGEMGEINKNLSTLMEEDSTVSITDADQLTEYGEVHLNGNQAVAYARIRNIGDDNGRAERQQTVLSALMDKATKMGVTEYPGMINQLSHLCETSMNVPSVMGFIPFALGGFSIEKLLIPGDYEGFDSSEDMENGAWMWLTDTDLAAQHLQEFIYENNASTDEDDSDSGYSDEE